jgi:hypothetical protein
MKESEWEIIKVTRHKNTTTMIDRFKIPEGWLYRTMFEITNGQSFVNVVFVPEKK